MWENDRYKRNIAGLPPNTNGDFAWVQHMIKSMKPNTGRMAVVLPHGVLFRMGKEGEMRRKILEMNLLDAVIGLGPNLFYGTGLAACILILSQQNKHPDQVLMIDASNLYKTGRNQNTLEPEHARQILKWVQNYEDVEGHARVVSLAEIEANDWNLNIPRYVEPIIEEETITVDEALRNLKMALAEAYTAEDQLKQLLMSASLFNKNEEV